MTIGFNVSSIRREARINSKLVTDLDNLREHYIDKDNTKDLYITFPSFDVHTFNKNYFIFLQKSKKVNFIPRWIMRPDYVSNDFYNNVIYWPLILYVNNVFTIEEFDNFDTILVPPFSLIMDLAKDRIIDDIAIPLYENDNKKNRINKLYIKYPLDNLELEKKKALKALNGDLDIATLAVKTVEKTETFTLSSADIINQYVDLEYAPDNVSSLSLRINNFNIAQTYNFDYTLIHNNIDKRLRISWKDSDIIDNNETEIQLPTNMGDFISEDDVLKIKYTISVTYKIVDGIPSI